MPDINSLYPQPTPAAPQGGLLADPGKAVGLMQALQSLQIQNAQAPALMQQPAVALAGQNISNAKSQYDLDASQTAHLHNMWGAMADKKGLGPEDVYNFAATAARAGIPATKIVDFTNRLHKYAGGYAQSAKDSRAVAVGSAGTMSPETGPPDVTGAPTVIRAGAANQGPLAGFPTGQAPGEADAQKESAKRGSDLLATAQTTNQTHADLDNLKQYSKVLEIGGPTVEIEKKLAQLGSRFGLQTTLTSDQLKAAEGFDKTVNNITARQAGQMGAATDAGRHMILGGTPSTSMSQYGREGVIDMAHGNQDAIDATRRAWADARARGVPAHAHDTFMNEFSKVIDPRVFQFNRLSRENQQKFLSQLDPSDLPEFETKYKDAISRKWVKPLKAAQ